MIVSCTNCQTKYSAADSKVDNKKFAFTCPSCNVEVIIDNRDDSGKDEPSLPEEKLPGDPNLMEETIQDDIADTASDDMEITGTDGIIEDEDIGVTIMEEAPDADAAGQEVPADEIDMDIEMPNLEELDVPGEEGQSVTASLEDDMDESLEINLDEVTVEEDISSKDEVEEDILIEATAGEEEPALDDIMADEPALDDITAEEPALDDITIEEPALDDITAEEPALDDITAEEESLLDDIIAEEPKLDDIEIEETTIDEISADEPVLDDIGATEDMAIDDYTAEEPKIEGEVEISDLSEPEIDDLGIDIENLEEAEQIDLTEDITESAPEIESALQSDDAEIISADVGEATDEFEPLEQEIDLEETVDADMPIAEDTGIEEEMAAIAVPSGDEDMVMDESITLDDVKSEEIIPLEESKAEEDDDQDITIDLDSLDIQLEEIENGAISAGEDVEDETISMDDISEDTIQEIEPEDTTGEEEEDITLDLDSLDLVLDETEETKEGEVLDDEERLSLADAGLTPDQIVAEKDEPKIEDIADDELRISIDEVGPDISTSPEPDVAALEPVQEEPIIDEDEVDLDELPIVDLDEAEKDDFELEPIADDEQLIMTAATDIDLDSEPVPVAVKSKFRVDELDDIKESKKDTVPRGTVSFSIDYSLKYSRIGALLRLTGIYMIGLIPHILINILYSVLSLILGFINYLLIVLTGESVEEYTEIQENTLRRLLSFGACYMDLVEEMPLYSGRKDIDYSLQFDVTYPFRYSRILAFLRLTVVGILLMTLPHIIIILILSLGCIPIFFAGIIFILIKRTWPNVLFDSMVKYFNYVSKVSSFIIGLVDEYPKFKLE